MALLLFCWQLHLRVVRILAYAKLWTNCCPPAACCPAHTRRSSTYRRGQREHHHRHRRRHSGRDLSPAADVRRLVCHGHGCFRSPHNENSARRSSSADDDCLGRQGADANNRCGKKCRRERQVLVLSQPEQPRRLWPIGRAARLRSHHRHDHKDGQPGARRRLQRQPHRDRPAAHHRNHQATSRRARQQANGHLRQLRSGDSRQAGRRGVALAFRVRGEIRCLCAQRAHRGATACHWLPDRARLGRDDTGRGPAAHFDSAPHRGQALSVE